MCNADQVDTVADHDQSLMLQLGQFFFAAVLGRWLLLAALAGFRTRPLHMRCNSIRMYVAAIVSRTAGWHICCASRCVSSNAIVQLTSRLHIWDFGSMLSARKLNSVG